MNRPVEDYLAEKPGISRGLSVWLVLSCLGLPLALLFYFVSRQ